MKDGSKSRGLDTLICTNDVAKSWSKCKAVKEKL